MRRSLQMVAAIVAGCAIGCVLTTCQCGEHELEVPAASERAVESREKPGRSPGNPARLPGIPPPAWGE